MAARTRGLLRPSAMSLVVMTMFGGAGCSSSKGSSADDGAGANRGGTVGTTGSAGAGAGGKAGTTGAGGSGGVAAVDPLLEWDEWPMPNDSADVAGPDGGVGAPNLESYTDNGDGTVTDNVTGLMWQQAVPSSYLFGPTTVTWSAAMAYCPPLSLGGHTHWRLPTEIELISLLDFSASPTPINQAVFPDDSDVGFWSSTPLAGSSSDAWIVHFNGGGNSAVDVTGTNAVRCVR